MEFVKQYYDEAYRILVHQLKSYWIDVDEKVIQKATEQALNEIEAGFRSMVGKRFYDATEDKVHFSPYMSVQWMVFLYRVAHAVYKQNEDAIPKEADMIYYLNKIMHANDWFYQIELPIHFMCEHPLGSVLGRAKYGDYLFVYQGTTVGGNRKEGVLSYPTIGNNVILYANATVLGDTKIGNNVVVSADSYIINEEVPDNCIVFGKSPDLVIKKRSEQEIKEMTKHIWRWE